MNRIGITTLAGQFGKVQPQKVSISLPRNHDILKFGEHHNCLSLWISADPDALLDDVEFELCIAGQAVPTAAHFIGSTEDRHGETWFLWSHDKGKIA